METVDILPDAGQLDRGRRVRYVAQILDTSERQIWRWIAEGKLRAERLGPRCVRIFDSEIARYRSAQRG
jgi:excisionase family DNA binding protein